MREHTLIIPSPFDVKNFVPGPSQLALWTLGGCVFSAFVLLGRDFGFCQGHSF